PPAAPQKNEDAWAKTGQFAKRGATRAIIDALKADFKSRNSMSSNKLFHLRLLILYKVRLLFAGKIRHLGKKIKFILQIFVARTLASSKPKLREKCSLTNTHCRK
ncbi:MAG: hypothetical protein M3N42_01035, partial [Cyanobacteriota bacterium]|nr:hypothetical protein [Cyanobacteriota bacterium]